MEKFIYKTKQEMGAAAAAAAAQAIKKAIEEHGRANIILATGASQFEMLKNLVQAAAVDFSKVTMFHLDEYIDMAEDHPASFRKFLKERFVEKVPGLKAVHFVAGDTGDPQQECKRVGSLINGHPIDAAMIGIGENGHLAFNDPPADFVVEDPYIIVNLDEACRSQQLGEGWFSSLAEVPQQAISMSIKQIMRSNKIVCVVPDRRKQQGVYKTLAGAISPSNPASILRKHKETYLYLDHEAAGLVKDLLS